MRTPLAFVLACLAFWAFLGSSTAVAADPPGGGTPPKASPPPLPNVSVSGPLAAEVQQMKVRIDFWVNMIRDANSDANAIFARDRLVEDYGKMADRAGDEFAAQAAAVAEPALTKGFGGDTMARVKEINLAMALSQMPQRSIQPALEAMVNCGRDPAVRCFGWKGYREARTLILGQGLPATQKALASLQKAARNENSGLVLGQLIRMTEMEATQPSAVTKDVWNLAQRQTFAVLTANWRPWCLRLMAGDSEANEPMAEACSQAVWAVRSHAEWVGQDKGQKRLILQMLVDMAWAAAKRFGQACAAGQPADPSFGALLLETEKALREVTNPDKEFIKKPLEDPKVISAPEMLIFWVDPVTKQNCGVEAWVDFLKDQGVVSPGPRFKTPATAPAPASGPATRPATAPK